MTVAAYKGGELVVDSAVVDHGMLSGITRKWCRHPKGGFMVGAGSLSKVSHLMECIRDNTRPYVSYDETEILWVSSEGVIRYHEHEAWTPPVEVSFTAIGSGSVFAMGAMAHGASAVQAVQLACRYYPSECGGPIWQLEVDTGKVYKSGILVDV